MKTKSLILFFTAIAFIDTMTCSKETKPDLNIGMSTSFVAGAVVGCVAINKKSAIHFGPGLVRVLSRVFVAEVALENKKNKKSK